MQTQTSSFLPQFLQQKKLQSKNHFYPPPLRHLEACKKKLDPFAGQTISAETQHLKRGGGKWKGGWEGEEEGEEEWERVTKTRTGSEEEWVEGGRWRGWDEGGRRRRRRKRRGGRGRGAFHFVTPQERAGSDTDLEALEARKDFHQTPQALIVHPCAP